MKHTNFDVFTLSMRKDQALCEVKRLSCTGAGDAPKGNDRRLPGSEDSHQDEAREIQATEQLAQVPRHIG